MLSHTLLRNHAGLMLIGDYTSLQWLHEVIHDINERSPLVKNKEGLFLGLAYDARKAFEGQRETIRPPKHFKEVGVRFGVQILWPVLLLQQRTMRASLAFMDHSRKHQAITYALEAVIEEGLRDDFGAQGTEAIERWQRLNPAYPEVFEKLDSRGALFCSWTKMQRQKGFLALLGSFDPMFESLYPLHVRNGDKPLLSPADFEAWQNVEWPDPKW